MQKPYRVYYDLSDRWYRERILAFLERYYSASLEMVNFHSSFVKEAGQKDPDGGQREGILLTDVPYTDSPAMPGYVLGTMRLGKEEGCVSPFRSGHEIARMLIAMCEEVKSPSQTEPERSEKVEEPAAEEEASLEQKPPGSRMIGVYSPSGGTGKSLLAMTLAEQIHQQSGEKVLLMTFDSASSWPLYFQAEDNPNLSDLFFEILSFRGKMYSAQGHAFGATQENGIGFVPSCPYLDDLAQMSEKETLLVQYHLREHYRFLVVDMGSQIVYPNRLWMLGCEDLCVLVDPSSDGKAKWENVKWYLPSESDGVRRWMLQTAAKGKAKASEGWVLPHSDQLFRENGNRRHLNTSSRYYQKVEELTRALLGESMAPEEG